MMQWRFWGVVGGYLISAMAPSLVTTRSTCSGKICGVRDKVSEGSSTNFLRYPNFLIIHCGIGGRKPPCHKPARFLQSFLFNTGLWRTDGYSALEALRLCAIYKSAIDNDIDFGIASRAKKWTRCIATICACVCVCVFSGAGTASGPNLWRDQRTRLLRSRSRLPSLPLHRRTTHLCQVYVRHYTLSLCLFLDFKLLLHAAAYVQWLVVKS